MTHAERQRLDALTRGERRRLAVQDDLASARRVSPHLDRAPVGRRRFRPERLESRFFRCEARREALGRGASDARPAVLSLVIRKHAPYVSLSEALERSSDVLDADDIDADVKPRRVHTFLKTSPKYEAQLQASCQDLQRIQGHSYQWLRGNGADCRWSEAARQKTAYSGH